MMKIGESRQFVFWNEKKLLQSECYEGVKKENCMRASETKK